MRILFLSNCGLDVYQGSGYVILGHAAGLRKRGHSVDVLGPDQLILLPWLHRGRRLRLRLGYALALRRAAKKGYDVINCFGVEAALGIRLLARHPLRKDWLLTSHSNGLEGHAARPHALSQTGLCGPESREVRWAFRLVDGIITVSEFDRSFALAERYQPDGRVISIENPLPEEFLADLPEVTGSRPKRVMFCGSWIARKGVALIKKDIPLFLRKNPDWCFRIVGVGNEFRPADHFPPELLNRIEVVPSVTSRTTMVQLYRESAIAIMPSIYESFGLVAAEAMAAGCALVATATGLAASLRDGVEACLIRSMDSGVLAAALTELAASPQSRIRLGIAGRQRVVNWHWADASCVLDKTLSAWHGAR